MASKSDPSRLELSCSSENDTTGCSRSLRSSRVAEEQKKRGEAGESFQSALSYFSRVKAGTPWRSNDVLERHLAAVERVALSQGLPPEAVSILLEFSLSLRMGYVISTRVLKFLVPASTVPQEAVLRGISWLCVDKMPMSMQVLFIRWVITMFDLIDSKDKLRAVYGFIFSFVTQETMCPYICHLLYLLTRKENVRLHRVRKLLELQGKMGRQPFLLHLLSLYKIFCPDLVIVSMPARMKSGFRNHNSTWKSALAAVQRSSRSKLWSDLQLSTGVHQRPAARKRKLNGCISIPPVSSTLHSSSRPPSSRVFPLEQLRTFPQLLENLHQIELPAQMGSMLGSSLALHFLDCMRDSCAFLRLNYWLGSTLHEEFLFHKDTVAQDAPEVIQFLDTLISVQHFLQEGFTATELFLYKFLRVWDGSLLRPQVLGLLSDIPVVPCSRIKPCLFEPLMQLFFTSSLFFKCSVVECLNSMLQKWLTWHSVYAFEDELDISVTSQTPLNMTLSGLMDSVMALVQFVGRISTIGLQLEQYHPLLLNFTLDFYETVSDMFLKYGMPLVVLPPAGVFYPALHATEPVSVDKLCHIMYRYRTNLISAKSQEQDEKKPIEISRKTYCQFNHYVVSMVSCLWNSRAFQAGTGLEVGADVLSRSRVPEHWARFSLIHHPAFLAYAIDFHQNCWPEKMTMDLGSIKGKYWDWFVEFLFCQDFHGLKEFVQSSMNRRTSAQGSKQNSNRSQEDAVAS
ncbi:centromere protein I [Paramormyrops kingsleyae]|uniref:Centromere protein I n=1 Tax=Paramormyrops kingsleyae TaxID=1676925 RepID=A0A3B3R6F1_9TELE|nr:centromere protein I [Paramormyrops kingsleyae]